MDMFFKSVLFFSPPLFTAGPLAWILWVLKVVALILAVVMFWQIVKITRNVIVWSRRYIRVYYVFYSMMRTWPMPKTTDRQVKKAERKAAGYRLAYLYKNVKTLDEAEKDIRDAFSRESITLKPNYTSFNKKLNKVLRETKQLLIKADSFEKACGTLGIYLPVRTVEFWVSVHDGQITYEGE